MVSVFMSIQISVDDFIAEFGALKQHYFLFIGGINVVFAAIKWWWWWCDDGHQCSDRKKGHVSHPECNKCSRV